MLAGQFTPGPDFLLVVKVSLNHGKKSGIFTSLGITIGLIIHCTIAITGLAFLFNSSEPLGETIKYAGSIYLAYLSFRLFYSAKKHSSSGPFEKNKEPKSLSNGLAFLQGFLTNLLNPKVVIFISAMLSGFISPESSLHVKLAYATIIIVQGFVFWALFSVALQATLIRKTFLANQKIFNITFAFLLLAVAVRTVYSG
ncbi:MAG: LysE family translocator [Verrucomicrobiales bacterium]|jgi:threonine/homoserine/homoserine lactone efflux protein|nr:LysE family translocator [Verrucomicrobiales bacterium]